MYTVFWGECMKKIFSENKFMMYCILISIIGFIGFFCPYGYEEWNFLFENLAWFPLELMVTVLILERILDSKKEKRESDKENKRFVELAGYRTNSLIKTLKENLYSAYTGKFLTNNAELLDEKLREMNDNFDDIFTIDYFDKGIDSLDINLNDLWDSFNHPINVSYPESILKFSVELNNLTDEYIEKNHYILPEEIFDEIVVLRNAFQESNVFDVGGMTPLIMKIFKENKNAVDEKSKQYFISEFKDIYVKIYNSLLRIEKVLIKMPPAK